MKKFFFLLTALISLSFSTKAMDYETARQEALFLTDKMAYELNLNDYQYEAVYEVNLDYLLSLNTYDDAYSMTFLYVTLDYQGLHWTRKQPFIVSFLVPLPPRHETICTKVSNSNPT